MPPRSKARSTSDFIQAGILAEGEVLRYLSEDDSRLLAVGQARFDGIELPGEAPMPLSSFAGQFKFFVCVCACIVETTIGNNLFSCNVSPLQHGH